MQEEELGAPNVGSGIRVAAGCWETKRFGVKAGRIRGGSADGRSGVKEQPQAPRLGLGCLEQGYHLFGRDAAGNAEGSDIHAQRDLERDVRWLAGCLWSR